MRLGLAVLLVSACSEPPECHHDWSPGHWIWQQGTTWAEVQANFCKNCAGLTARACVDGSGKSIGPCGLGPTLWFDAQGNRIGATYQTDVASPDSCNPEIFGTVPACDTTPVDLGCAATP